MLDDDRLQNVALLRSTVVDWRVFISSCFCRMELSFTDSHTESLGFTYRYLNVYISEDTLRVLLKFGVHTSIRPQ